MIKIAFDLDGTCIDLESHIRILLLEKTGIDISNSTQYKIEKEFGISKKVFWDCVYDAYKNWQTIRIYPYVEEVMQKLYENNKIPIYFVTSRSAKFATETHDVIERFCKKIPFYIAMPSSSHDKGRYLKGHDYFMDDRRQTALELSSQGINVFIPDRSYNRGCGGDGIVRLKNGMEDLLFKIILGNEYAKGRWTA